MTPSQVVSQINLIIQRMIEAGLSDQQNYPTTQNTAAQGVEIGISGAPLLAISMKEEPYEQIYKALDGAKAYHIKTIDGALIQMCYRFRRQRIVAHRLCMFPAPHLINYDSDPELYENDEVFSDIISKGILHFPIRFDFDASPDIHVDMHHPKSHLTLGQYPNCRIPVNAPITPARFIKFILRNFYYIAFHKTNLDIIDSAYKYDDTLTENERSIAYLTC